MFWLKRKYLLHKIIKEKEMVLSFELGPDDLLYRIRRGDRIVYIRHFYPDFVPESDQTDSERVLLKLRELPAWNGRWSTLEIRKTTSKGFVCEADTFQPHRLTSYPDPNPSDQYYNLLNLERTRRINERTSLISLNGREYIMKIARFDYELRYLYNEVRAYGILMVQELTLSPKFVGYVYEESQDRVVGFLLERLEGRHPGDEDFVACENALQRLHACGIVHGDLYKPNILIGDDVRFVDFEDSRYVEDDDYEQCKVKERETLAEKLADTSGLGDYGM
ncbi:MAG: hypothetical protein Q9217_000383 [Psora testacea]